MDLHTYVETHGQAPLARALDVTPGMVWQWKEGMRKVPADRVLAIETATGGQVTRYELRPDVFGPAPAQSEAA